MDSHYLGLILAVIVPICCTFSNVWSSSTQEHGTVEELIQRIRRVEDIQRAQEQTIQEQAIEIAELKSKCVPESNKEKIKDGDNSSQRPLEWKQDSKTDWKDKEVQIPGEGNARSTDRERINARENTSADGSDIVKKRRFIVSEAGISFTAYIDHSVNLGDRQILKFNQVITNEGAAYNTNTGIFTCPMDGVYMLAFYIGETNVSGVWLNLVVNNNNLVDAAVDTYHQSQDLQGGNVVLKRLSQGDTVWVELVGDGHVEGSNSLRLTTFSGVLLYQ